MLRLIALLIILAPAAWAATPSPTVPVYKCAIDFRRNGDCGMILDGSYIDPFTLTAGQTISLTTPVSDSSIYAAYHISPMEGHYLVRNMGEGTPPQKTVPTAIGTGTGWEKDRADGALAPGTGTRWVAISNPNAFSVSGTISWASMVTQ